MTSLFASVNLCYPCCCWRPRQQPMNIFRIRGYNAVNLKLGYSQIDIRSPKEIITNEE